MFMNRVHEQCPKIDLGTVLSQTGSKQAECTKCTACWPAAHPGRAPSACAAGALRAREPAAARALRTRLPARLQPACAQPSTCAPLLRAPLCHGPVSRHSPAAHCPSCHNTIFVLRYKFSPASLPATIH